jgi:hypothetical protein
VVTVAVTALEIAMVALDDAAIDAALALAALSWNVYRLALVPAAVETTAEVVVLAPGAMLPVWALVAVQLAGSPAAVTSNAVAAHPQLSLLVTLTA